MAQHPDEERIRRKAHELWEADGHPHGRDQDHWDQAREMVAIEDSQYSTLLPRNTGAEEPVEWREAAENYGDFPNLTDQGNDGLTDVSREPVLGGTEPVGSARKLGAKARKSEKAAALQPDETKPTAKRNGSEGTAAVSIVAESQKRSGRKGSGKTV